MSVSTALRVCLRLYVCVYGSTCMSTALCLCQRLYVYVYGSVSMSTALHLCLRLYVCVYGSTSMSTALCLCLRLYVYVYGSMSMSTALRVCLRLYVYVYGSTSMFTALRVCLRLCVYVYGSVSSKEPCDLFDWMHAVMRLSRTDVKSYVSFAEYCLFYRALLQKRTLSRPICPKPYTLNPTNISWSIDISAYGVAMVSGIDKIVGLFCRI